MYPVGAPQPIAEMSIGDGRPEPTNEAYAVAKLATASLASAYRKQFGTTTSPPFRPTSTARATTSTR